jgi:hypothetical protein
MRKFGELCRSHLAIRGAIVFLFIAPVILMGQLTSVSITPSDRVVNQTATHLFQFTTTGSIPANGRLVFIYPAGFNLSGVNTVSSSTMDGLFIISFAGTTLTITRTGGIATPAGSVQNLQFSLVRNPTTSGSKTFTLRTETNTGTLIDQGSCIDFIYPGPLNYFVISAPTTATAGINLSADVVVTARDEFGNRASTYSGIVTWSTSDPHSSVVLPTDDGSGWANGQKTFLGSGFVLITKGNQTLTVQDGSATGTSGNINVGSGNVADFNISAGATQTAGVPFVLSISNAVDNYGNSINGTVSVDVFNGGGNAPNGDPPSIPSSITVTNGSGSASNVILTNAVSTQFRGTDGSVVRYAPAIMVLPTTISNFSIGASSPVTAGVAFPLQVTNAVDQYGNAWSGTIYVDASQGGGNSPDGSPPSFNDIYVNSGTGSAQQILVSTASTILRGQSGGTSATTISLLVSPGGLHAFTIKDTPAAVEAGTNFPTGVTVTAFDVYGNIKTNYNGSAYFTCSDPQALLTYNNGNPYPFSSGNVTFPGSAFQLRTAGTQFITIIDAAPDPDVTASSPFISVQSSTVSQFTMTCAATQVAGQAFPIYISNAQDSYGNPWTGMVSVSATQGAGNSPNGALPSFNSISVNNGNGQANQILVNKESSVTLQTQSGSVIRSQSDIIVLAGSLSTLKIRDAGGGLGNEVVTRMMIVGSGITFFAAGYDIYGNYRVDEPCDWSSVGTLTPQVNAQNLSSVSFSPSAPGIGTLSAVSVANPSVSDYTGTITVESGVLHHFSFEPILTQIKDVPILITVTAEDENNNIVNSFDQSVQLSDLTGTVQPITLEPFHSGRWVGNVTISQTFENNRLMVLGPTGKTGQSNEFDVVVGPGSRIIKFQAVSDDTISYLKSITTSQQRDWFVKMGVENLGSVVLRLDSIRLSLKVNGIPGTDYTIIYPTQFWGNGTNLLAGGATDSLLIRVDVSGQASGPMTLEGSLHLRDQLSGNPLPPDDASTSLTVQTPAVLSIQQIHSSKKEVTRGQQGGWYVTMILHNSGESELLVDSNHLRTGISFSIGSAWLVGWPESLAGGDWYLGGKETDSLLYNIEQTGDGQLGVCQIDGFCRAQELNTGRVLNATNSKSIVIEEPPLLRIISVRNLAENAPHVNKLQPFTMQIQLENSGGDRIKGVVLNFQSSLQTNSSSFPSDYPIGELAGGETKTITINAAASPIPASSEIVQVFGSGIAENTSFGLLSSDALDDTSLIIIQNPAKFQVVTVIPTQIQLLGGQVDEWRVKVAVRNPKTDPSRGQAQFVIDSPKPTDLDFTIEINQQPVKQEDYTVVAPAGLKSGGLILRSGLTDTLIYRITATGRQGGTVTIDANLSGFDQNNSQLKLQAEGSATVSVKPEEKLRIISTRADAINMVSDVAYVNTNQSFNLTVTVENGLGQSVKNVRIALQGDGGSTIADSIYRWIPVISPSKTATVEFTARADDQARLSGEQFIASIVSARYQLSGNPAPSGPAIDSTAKVIIQNPAQLDIELTTPSVSKTYSTNQVFTIAATIINVGDAQIDDSGILQIFPPSLYTMVSTDTLHLKLKSIVQWTIRSPSTPQSNQLFSIGWYRKPRDVNSGLEAIVSSQPLNPLYIQTVNSYIFTDLSIVSPFGATDDTLSTDQSFIVQAIVQWANSRDITTTLTLPQGYNPQTDLEQVINFESPVKMDTVTWLVHAPSVASIGQTIQVTSRGYDAIQPTVPVIGQPAQPLIVTTVPRAALGMTLEITNPPDAQDGSLSLGQSFTIEVQVTNFGEADTLGQTLVSIDPLPRGYSISDASLTKPIENGSASWVVKAPTLASVTASKIEARLVEIPVDENTNDPVHVLPNQGSYSIAVTTESYLLAVGPASLNIEFSKSIVPGQNRVPLMALSLDNRGIRGGNKVIVDGISFDVEDRFGEEISPSSVISRAYIVNQEATDEIFGVADEILGENPVTISFTRLLSIPVDGNPVLAILVDIRENVTIQYFQVNIRESSYISAKDGNSNFPVPVKSLTEEDWIELRSTARYIYNPETELNLWSCPNPFSDLTTVYYHLEEPSDVTFRIFTLIGDPVWTLELPAVSAGPHTLLWDGTNDSGKKILNGVYWLFMQTDNGVEGKFKIAVVK